MREALQSILPPPQEKQVPALPAGISAILVMVSMMVSGILSPAQDPAQDLILVSYCMLNCLYLGHFHFVMIRSPRLSPLHIWGFVFGEVLVGAIVAYLIPLRSASFLAGLMVLLSITISIISSRGPSYAIAAGFSFSLVLVNLIHNPGPAAWISLIISILMAGVSIETIHQLKHLTRRNINRLEVINEFSRQITSSLDSKQVLTLLNATVQNAFEADTYMVGLQEGSDILFELLYDDGEYYSNESVKLDGSIAGWVIRNQRELFLSDMRGNPRPPGVQVVMVGKPRISLSWMGVPIAGLYTRGIIAIASYRPNAFDRSDLELMHNMARHAALALDNTFRHAQVEEQSRLDSLTGVYNHGSFLRLLERKTDEADRTHTPLALIMLDIDHFKHYNDQFGHRSGDEVLTAVCATVRRYIKRSDIVGRWGGEEFAVALPGANIKQAYDVARRIHDSILHLRLWGHDREIPAPTLSQGIAEFPLEARDMMELIDLADRRLYIAKERGRNQIEPLFDTSPVAEDAAPVEDPPGSG
jgi:diguanylate cyclase (GGDEF)-like protein